MGARVSIQFKKGNEKSVILFSHWGGKEFVETAKSYVNLLKEDIEKEKYQSFPLGRLEPQTVMIDFIRELTSRYNGERVISDLYLGVSDGDGDNSDFGNHIINLD